MRDGNGNRLSEEEQQKVRSIQGAPDEKSVSGISIDPNPDKPGEAAKPGQKAQKPAIGGAE